MPNLKNISLTLNIIFIAIFAALIYTVLAFDLIPFLGDNTNDSISNVPVLDVADLVIEPVVEGLEVPWDVEFVGEDVMLITERPGRVRIVVDGELQSEPILDLTSEVASVGEAGLMGMTKHPDFAENNLVYFYMTLRDEGSDIFSEIRTYEFVDNQLINPQTIFDPVPAGRIHASGQLEFGPDGKLYLTTGDIGDRDLAQDLDNLAGKTLRMNYDGSVPEDSFYRLVDSRIPEDGETLDKWYIYSYGHRNAQGIAWHPVTGEMFQSEHGPSGIDGGTGQDEINQVRRGANMGWPVITGAEAREGMYSPLLSYTPAIAPASAHFYNAELIPELKNMLLVGALRGNELLAIEINTKGEAIERYRLTGGEYGRIRHVTTGPDGAIYFTTSNQDGRGEPRPGDDKVYRITRI